MLTLWRSGRSWELCSTCVPLPPPWPACLRSQAIKRWCRGRPFKERQEAERTSRRQNPFCTPSFPPGKACPKHKQRTFISFQLKEELFCYEKSCVFPVGKGNRTKCSRGRGVFLELAFKYSLVVRTIDEIAGEESHVMQSFSHWELILIKGEYANFFVSRHIPHPQILGLIPQSKIREFLRCANLQIRNPQIN